MRGYSELRLIVFKLGERTVKTHAIVVAEWPEWEHNGWRILAVDPEDELALLFWQEQGWPSLPHLI
jgi:hypothetical protein